MQKGASKVRVVGADMPALLMLMIASSYLFSSHKNSSPEEEAKIFRPSISFRKVSFFLILHLLIGLTLTYMSAAICSYFMNEFCLNK